MTRRQRLAALALAVASFAAGAAEEPARWYLQVDNDVVFVTDRWYSSGVRIARVSGRNGSETEFGLVHEIYVPEQRNWEPGKADRAPTARVMLNAAFHQRDALRFDTLEAQVGVRGPAALGKETTELVHRAIRADDVDWSRQLPGNHIDASLVATRSQWLDSIPLRMHAGAVVGTQLAFVHLGGELRLGPGSRDIDFQVMRFAATPPFAARKDDVGWSVFAGANARGVARNMLVGRNYDPGAPDVHMKSVVGRFAAGAAWTLDRGSITFALVQETREFDEQRRPQRFGSLGLNWNF